MSHHGLHLPRFSDVAPIENASLIDTPPICVSTGHAYFQFPGSQTAASYAKLTVEQAVEADGKGSVPLSPGDVGRKIPEATHRILSKKSDPQALVLVSDRTSSYPHHTGGR